jgi:serine/threonine-protein kinase
MQALVDAGDRAGAIQHAAAFTRTLHDELGVEGDEAVTRFAKELRSGLRPSTEVIPDKALHDATRLPATKPGEASLLVVLPFAVHGETAHHYLEQGMVDLLSRSLDGAGTLRVVDPYAVIGLTSRSATGAADPELGRQVSHAFGAELFVLGSVVGAHGRLQVFATLYHLQKGRLVTAEASVADEGALFEIVEDLTRQLLIGRLTPAQQMTRIAATLTPSIAALKAYLTGESHYRRGRFGQAREALEKAVSEDPSFAVAWYRLGHVVFWQHQGELAVQHTRRAVSLSDRLRGQERALIGAFLSSLEGRHREAERLYREVVSVYPENVEAWLGLAQVMLHFNPFRGRAAAEAHVPLARVLELDPENGPARMFTAYVFAKEGQYEEHQSNVRHWDDKSEFSIYPRAMHALLRGTDADADAIIKELSLESDATVNEACRYVARLTSNLPGAERIARLLLDPGRSRTTNAYGLVLLAQLAAAAGRHAQAFGALSEASRFDPDAALLQRGYLATLPFLPVPAAEIDEIRGALDAVNAKESARLADASTRDMHEGLHEALRLYVLGHVHARAEAFADASIAAERLAALDVTPASSALVNDWARGVRAHIAWRRRQVSDALALLEGSHLEVSWAQRLAPSPFLSQNFERYLRAQLLDTVGRDEDALGWYESVTGDFTHEVVFLAPSYLRRAQLHDRRGDYSEAREFYQRFISLWRGGEPEEALVVKDAQQRLIRLGGPIAQSGSTAGGRGLPKSRT